jgi:hypothetical protein
MALDDRGLEWGSEWKCSLQTDHILTDPEHWSVDVIDLGDDATDIDGDPISGMVPAELLRPEDLRTALGLEPVLPGSEADRG